MTPAICKAAEVGTTSPLIDRRDNKSYWVAKLADENCWMTQNLALDLDEQTTPLTSELSDVISDWTPTQPTEHTVPTVSAGDYTGTRSWNLGEYVLATPQKAVVCNSAPSGGSTDDDGNNSLRPNQNFNNTSNCTDFQAVDNTWTYSEATQGVWNGYTGLVAADRTTKTYDSHYLIGNYYQFNAATAGTGSSTGGGDAPSSICPKGWKLPSNVNGQYHFLIGNYNIGNNATGVNTLTAAPLYFVRGGNINMTYGVLRHAGSRGYYWTSSVQYSALAAHDLYFNVTDVYSMNSDSQYFGFFVRCVAKK